MEEMILAEDLLERVEGLIHQLDDTVSDRFVIIEELLHQVKEELENLLETD